MRKHPGSIDPPASGPRFDLPGLIRLYALNTLRSSRKLGPAHQSSHSLAQQISDHIRFAQIMLILLADRSLGSSRIMNINSAIN